VGARLTDSAAYGHLWGTAETRALFEERARLGTWTRILVALARAQADEGLVPGAAADAIARADPDDLDVDLVAAETRRTGHSTLGFIRGLQAILPEHAREWVYYGATVQDVTDTWFALTMRDVGALVWRDLTAVERSCIQLARQHRDTAMAGRTHGQVGAPITFGLKAAGWADEVGRHLDRLEQGRDRWLVAQLAGAVGTLDFFGARSGDVRRRFCAQLGLGEPPISWTSARDRVAEFVVVLALVTATLARIANEIFELQRPEIGEVREPAGADTVGSITMPHKRNPERSEHIVTLSRLVRAQAGVVLEGMVSEHERDGRAWKAEWAAFPEACLLSSAALSAAADLLAGLEVDEAAMSANLAAASGWHSSERVLARLSPRLGKHRAQSLLQELARRGRARGQSLAEALSASDELRTHLGDDAIASLSEAAGTGAAGEMVDAVVRRARGAAGSAWA
jgi:adenylosuccinate lyase